MQMGPQIQNTPGRVPPPEVPLTVSSPAVLRLLRPLLLGLLSFLYILPHLQPSAFYLVHIRHDFMHPVPAAPGETGSVRDYPQRATPSHSHGGLKTVDAFIVSQPTFPPLCARISSSWSQGGRTYPKGRAESMWVVTITVSTVVLGLVEGMTDRQAVPMARALLASVVGFHRPWPPWCPLLLLSPTPGYVPAPSSKLWLPFTFKHPQERKLEVGRAIHT